MCVGCSGVVGCAKCAFVEVHRQDIHWAEKDVSGEYIVLSVRVERTTVCVVLISHPCPVSSCGS